MGFGDWLLEKRKEARLTQGELASRAKISTSYVSTLEREQPHGITNTEPKPAADVVDALATALGAELDEARLAAGYAAREAPDRTITLKNIGQLTFQKSLAREARERYAIAIQAAIAAIDATDEEKMTRSRSER